MRDGRVIEVARIDLLHRFAARLSRVAAGVSCCAGQQVLEGGLARAGVPYSYGFAIILLTLMVKVATYPLTKKSVGAGALLAT